MADVILLTPREVPTGAPSLNNQNVLITDEEYARLEPAMRIFYEKVRENLGLACMTAHLRAQGWSVIALNFHGRHPDDEAIVDLIRRERPKLVGVSILYDLHIIDAVRLVRCARTAAPDTFVAAGGAFCTYNSDLIAREVPHLDCVAFGEGELTVAGIMNSLRAGTDWRRVPGLFYRDGADVRSSGMPHLLDLENAVWPARDVLEAHRRAGIPTPVASTYTSRGCHANCTFCYAPRQPGVLEGPWRVRPAGDVVDEIERLQRDFGTRFIWFNDDNFGGAYAKGVTHAIAFAEELMRRNVSVSFHCEMRVDSGLIDSEALDLLRRAGMASALLGMESGSPGMLKRFRKGTTATQNYDAAAMFRSKGIELDPGWILIEPQTSLDELWEDLAFVVGSEVHRCDNPFFLVNRAIALRGTEMFDRIARPLPPVDVAEHEGPAWSVLRQARRDYRVDDDRVEALWEAWSAIGADISERKENQLPFVAQAIAAQARASAAVYGSSPRSLLTRLRRWRNQLADLFVAVVDHGLVVADEDPPDLRQRLHVDLRKIVEAYDIERLGCSFAAFLDEVEQICGPVRAPGMQAVG